MSRTFGSLFSGIGGIDLGLQRAGFEVKWQCEIDDYAQKVLAKHWPNTPRFRDIRECGVHNLTSVDLIAGGFPCQPHSLAGKRKAGADERNLWPEFYRIICELRPQWVLAENVPGLLSSEHGQFFGRVLRDLATCGYDAEWQVLSAAAFGAPHIRERVFLVAYANGSRRNWWEHQPISRQYECTSYPGQNGNKKQMADTRSTGCQELDIATLTDRQGYATRRSPAPGTMEDAASRRERQYIFPRRAQGPQPLIEQSSWWATESSVGRVADGVPRRVDRLRGLGNAVVPQVAEYIGRCIMEVQR